MIPEQPIRWKPKYGDPFFYAHSHGIEEGTPDYSFIWDGDVVDEMLWDNYNVFSTKEEAEKEAIRTRARRKLEWFAQELNKGKETDSKYVYDINRDCKVRQIASSKLFVPTLGMIIFYDMDDAEYDISQMTADELEVLK
jgi:hypothetical protein